MKTVLSILFEVCSQHSTVGEVFPSLSCSGVCDVQIMIYELANFYSPDPKKYSTLMK